MLEPRLCDIASSLVLLYTCTVYTIPLNISIVLALLTQIWGLIFLIQQQHCSQVGFEHNILLRVSFIIDVIVI